MRGYWGGTGMKQGKRRQNRQACVIPPPPPPLPPHPSRSWGWGRWWDYTCSSVVFSSSSLHPLTPLHLSRSWGWEGWWDYTCSSVLFSSSLLHSFTSPTQWAETGGQEQFSGAKSILSQRYVHYVGPSEIWISWKKFVLIGCFCWNI